MKPKQELVIGDSKSLRRFVNSINSPRTEETYVNNLKGYLEYHNIKEFDELIEIDKEKTFDMITNYLTFNRKEKQRSNSRINGILCSIRLFYLVNNYQDLNWHVIARYKGKERKKVADDRAYTREEIQLQLQHADLRMKVAILVMESSGVRVEGLVNIKLKDLEYIEKNKLYKIRVYSDDLHESYYTFTSPECSHYINLYLDERKRKHGENVNDNSPILRKDMDSSRDLTLKPHSITERIRRINIESGVQASFQVKENEDIIEVRRQRHEVMTCHGYRKHFSTVCTDSNMKYIAKEMLMGHKKEQGLDRSYYRPTSDNLLNEYLKVVDELTINDEYRLKKENSELKEDIQQKLKQYEEELEQQKQENVTIKEAAEEVFANFKKFTADLRNNKNHPLRKEIEKLLRERDKEQNKMKERAYRALMRLDEMDKRRDELMSKKGFVTQEDEEAIDNDVRESLKQTDPDLAKFIEENKKKKMQ